MGSALIRTMAIEAVVPHALRVMRAGAARSRVMASQGFQARGKPQEMWHKSPHFSHASAFYLRETATSNSPALSLGTSSARQITRTHSPRI